MATEEKRFLDSGGLEYFYTKLKEHVTTRCPLEYIFPKKFDTQSQGEMSLLRYRNEKNILIDCGNTNTNTYLAEMINNNGGGKLYAFIISHYDLDHAGSWQYVLENFCDENTKIYLPADVQTYGQDPITARTNIINYCTAHGLTAHSPLEGEELEVDSLLKLKFLNCDVATLDAEVVKSYNNCSLCVWITHKNTTSFFTGDIGQQAMTRLYDVGYPVSNVTLFKVPHHGSDIQCNERFIYKLCPQYAIQQTPTKTSTGNATSLCRMTSIIRECGAKTYVTYRQPDYNRLISNGDVINCEVGVVGAESSGIPSLTIYVDANASDTAIQDGTETHPFGNLPQALASIPRNGIKDVTINLADGDYCYGTGNYDINRCNINVSKDIKVIINGNSLDNTAVNINGIRAERAYVILNHVTVDLDNNDGIEAFNSYIQLNDVVFKPLTADKNASRNCIHLRGGSYATNNGSVELHKAGYGIKTEHATFMTANTIHIDDITNPLTRNAGDTIYTGNYFTFETASDAYSFSYKLNPKSPVSIMAAHTEYASSVTTLVNFKNLDWVEIYYKSSHNRYSSTGRIYNPDNKYIDFLSSFTSSVDPTFSQARVKLLNTTIAIEQTKETVCSAGGNTITSPAGLFDIVKVIGGFKDYVELS